MQKNLYISIIIFVLLNFSCSEKGDSRSITSTSIKTERTITIIDSIDYSIDSILNMYDTHSQKVLRKVLNSLNPSKNSTASFHPVGYLDVVDLNGQVTSIVVNTNNYYGFAIDTLNLSDLNSIHNFSFGLSSEGARQSLRCLILPDSILNLAFPPTFTADSFNIIGGKYVQKIKLYHPYKLNNLAHNLYVDTAYFFNDSIPKWISSDKINIGCISIFLDEGRELDTISMEDIKGYSNLNSKTIQFIDKDSFFYQPNTFFYRVYITLKKYSN